MTIYPCGAGLHHREVKSKNELDAKLPDTWYGYSNLDLVLGRGITREVDLVLVADHYIFVADVKDWYGKIVSENGNWIQNGKDRGGSPVKKVTEIKRRIFEKLQGHMKSHKETRNLPVPLVHGIVLMAGDADWSTISDLEKDSVFDLQRFIKLANGKKKLREHFGNVAPDHLHSTFAGAPYKGILTRFFNVKSGIAFEPGKRRFQGLVAESAPTFKHPGEIYSEYAAHEERVPLNTATLRLWDFSKCDTNRFQTEEGRHELTGRERSVFHWLRDRNSFSEKYLLSPVSHDVESSVDYWEAFERRSGQKRLSDFALTELGRLSVEERVELGRQLLAAIATLHECDAAHLDIGAHSIWLESPTTVRLSHLMAAHLPSEKSLGADRYQFLSSVNLPETILGLPSSPRQKDVYLVAVAVHTLLFGAPPDGIPPEWDPSVDANTEFGELHYWFSSMLDHDPSLRPASCSEALTTFNKLTSSSTSSAEVLAKLEQGFSKMRSQLQVARAYPLFGEMLEETNVLDSWVSELPDGKVLVKIWKQAAFGDIKKNGHKICDFLERAKNLHLDRPNGLARVLDYSWLSDAVVVTFEWVEGEPLDEFCRALRAQSNPDPISVLELVRGLVETIRSLHGEDFAHGDLKPSNIIVKDDGTVRMIDILDLALDVDGGYSASCYAPAAGSYQERDRFAALKISSEIISSLEGCWSAFSKANERVQSLLDENSPTVLEPFIEFLDEELEILRSPNKAEDDLYEISISIRGSKVGAIEPDEGKMYFRHRRSRDIEFLHIRGSKEELMLAISPSWEIQWIKRQEITQSSIIRSAKHEFFSKEISIVIEGNSFDSWGSLNAMIGELEIQGYVLNGSPSQSEEDHDDHNPGSDAGLDQLAEKIDKERLSRRHMPEDSENAVDIPSLWRKLIEVEDQLTIEGYTTGPSQFDTRLKLHSIPIELEGGQLDFNREDRVVVEKETRGGKWMKVGQLDLRQSRNDLIYVTSFIDNERFAVEENTKLRFDSFFSSESLRRRKSAVDRVLSGNGRTNDLVAAFDARADFEPSTIDHELDHDAVASYNLNVEQRMALEGAICTRPMSLVQGPPGTGKTRFIAALTHYALTHGLARNVLLSSQSHEAVNTAIDGVLRHFLVEGQKPNIFRVGSQQISGPSNLNQYFAHSLERALKDRFTASFRDRIAIAAEVLGIPPYLAHDIATIESTITDMTQSLERISRREAEGSQTRQRFNGLRESLQVQLDAVLAEGLDLSERTDFADCPNQAIEALSRKTRELGIGDDKIEKLRKVIRLARDFTGSSSSSTRSYEPFFAGTREIVAGTCVGLGRRALGLTDTTFDLVIIDEAARCTPSELLVPLQASRWTVLVGDHAQLLPHHEAEVISTVSRDMKLSLDEVAQSDFERVFKSKYAKKAGFRMREQYRMLPGINSIVANSFYEGLDLSAGRKTPFIPNQVLAGTLSSEVTWIDTDSLGNAAFESTAPQGQSKVNEAEADTIVRYLSRLNEEGAFSDWLDRESRIEHCVGIICMYAAQRDLIRRKLNTSDLARYLDKGIKVGTVDSYQGKENPIIILSLVRNNKEGPTYEGRRTIREGFLVTPNRINVALSRAMDRLVIVGSKRGWRPKTPLHKVSQEFDKLVPEGTAKCVPAVDVLDFVSESGVGGVPENATV